jgi:Protein of unknown function (DUF1016).
LFVDFLGLPQKHSETKLKKRLIEHMKQFILELGKDFIFVDQEYNLSVVHQLSKLTYCSSIARRNLKEAGGKHLV